MPLLPSPLIDSVLSEVANCSLTLPLAVVPLAVLVAEHLNQPLPKLSILPV